jgi:hypothetical protein
MSRPSLKTLAANAACLLALGWLYGGDLFDAFQARRAEVSALVAIPSKAWPLAVLSLTAGALAVGVWGLWRGRGEGFKGYRLLPILLLCALFVDLMVAENRGPLRSDEVAFLSLYRFQELAQALATARSVPKDPAQLSPLLKELGAPPYLVRGVRPGSYSLQVRHECEGPVLQAPGAAPGTLLYCVARDHSTAWVTLVGLPAGERFGSPAILSLDGEPAVKQVRALPQEKQGEQAPEPFREERAPHARPD